MFCRALGHLGWGIITMLAFIVMVLSCELRSGVALDSWWKASYRTGDWQYRAIVAWHILGLFLLLGMSYFFVTLPSPAAR